MEKKLAQDGRRAEAEILIQEMLDRFRSQLEQEYRDKIKSEDSFAMKLTIPEGLKGLLKVTFYCFIAMHPQKRRLN